MPLARTWSIGLVGVHGEPVEIEADIGAGLPGTKLVGLPDAGLREARERVRSAVRNCGCAWPKTQVTLGLSPADLPKLGSSYDLGIAVAVLVANGVAPATKLSGTVWLGELALDGRIRPVRGVLPSVLAARAAGMKQVIVPSETLAEAAWVDGIDVAGVTHLVDALEWLRDELVLAAPPPRPDVCADPAAADLADVVGQPEARHAVEVAAAGGHHVLMVGPPGVGKTMLAKRVPGLLPQLSDDEALEVLALRSVDGSLGAEVRPSRIPPLVAPHHSVSVPALIGGGSGLAVPGAVSKAHRGVLLIDEACEFGPHRLDALRTALEEGQVRLARSRGVVTYPAQFQLILATNPCPCAPPRDVECSCSPQNRRRYFNRLSGPLLDRVDIRVRMRPISALDVGAAAEPEGTAVVAERVRAARHRAAWRWSGHGWSTNAEVPGRALRGEYGLPTECTALLDRALERGAITARGADRCLRLAWTLADLEGLGRPGADEVAMALQYRDGRTA